MTLYIHCQVTPQSRIQKISRIKDKYYKVKLVATPEKGKANKELFEVLSVYFNLPKSCFTITSGATSPAKLIRIERP
jgi:uncharacterized protein (TIGR00251 family)